MGEGRDGAVAVAALIAAQGDAHHVPAVVACRALGVSRSWYYKWRGATLPPRAQRRARLMAEVGRLFAVHEGKYGSPRITADLREAGWRVSENTVAGLLRELGLAARRGCSLDRGLQPRPPALRAGHAQPAGLRARPGGRGGGLRCPRLPPPQDRPVLGQVKVVPPRA